MEIPHLCTIDSGQCPEKETTDNGEEYEIRGEGEPTYKNPRNIWKNFRDVIETTCCRTNVLSNEVFIQRAGKTKDWLPCQWDWLPA